MGRDGKMGVHLAVPANGFAGRLEVIAGPRGRRKRTLAEKARIVAESLMPGIRVADVARQCVQALGHQLQQLRIQTLALDRQIIAWHRANETSRRLDELPGVGPALATALVASVPDAKVFRSGRDFSAWIGLLPKQSSSGGKERLGNITKQGGRYLRSLFTTGTLAVIQFVRTRGAQAMAHQAARTAAGESGGHRARR
jgi:transposase